jgi:hypothetical protein
VRGGDRDGRQFTLTVAARQGKSAAGQSFPILIANPTGFRPRSPLSPSAQAALLRARRAMA